MKDKNLNFVIALVLILIGVSLRVIPHPANFAPVAAISIFGGAVLPRKTVIWVPLSAMIVSDAIIGFYNMMFVTWGCYLLIALASSIWLKKPSLVKGGILTVSSSTFFFLVTNFAVWLTSGMYPHSWSGFINCYYLALPFFRNTLLSDAIYTGALFGAFALATSLGKTLLKNRAGSTA